MRTRRRSHRPGRACLRGKASLRNGLACRGHVDRSQSFRALFDFEFHLGAFLQGAVAFRLDGGVVHENILPAGGLNKSKPFIRIEPLYGAFLSHEIIS